MRSELKMCSKKTFSPALSAGDFTYNSHKMANPMTFLGKMFFQAIREKRPFSNARKSCVSLISLAMVAWITRAADWVRMTW